MRKSAAFLIALFLLCVLAAAGPFLTAASAANARAFTALTGGGTGAMDKVSVGALTDGDLAWVINSSDDLYFYRFESSATDAEDSPYFIRPDDYSSAGVWYLVDSFTLRPSATPGYTMRDSGDSTDLDSYCQIYANCDDGSCTDDSEDYDFYLKCYIGGSLTTVLHLDCDASGNCDIDLSPQGTGVLQIASAQIDSDDLSDVASIAMLDEAETVTAGWGFNDVTAFYEDVDVTLDANDEEVYIGTSYNSATDLNPILDVGSLCTNCTGGSLVRFDSQNSAVPALHLLIDGSFPTISDPATYTLGVDGNIVISGGDLYIASSAIRMGTNYADSGEIRLANTHTIEWRNAANSSNIIGLTVDGSDNVLVGDTSATMVKLQTDGAVKYYEDANNADPAFYVGTSDAESFQLWGMIGSGDKLLDEMRIITSTDQTGDGDGKITFYPDGEQIVSIYSSNSTYEGLYVNGRLTLQSGESLNTATDDTFDFTRNDAGTVTLTASDDDATAALTVLPGGAAALTLGGASTTSIALTTDGGTVTLDGSITIGSAGIEEAELEILDGATLGTADINIIDGVSDSGSLTAAELLYVDGVTSAIQTQIDAKLSLSGGTLTGEATVDDLGLEFTAGDTLTDCSTFSATGGGIFFDDSEGIFKKCQDNVLTDLDTGAGTVNTADIADVNVTQTELAELETIGSTTVSANQWALLGGLAETLTAAEVNVLDGATAATADINIIDGISDSGTLTAAELLYVDGVSSAIQTQIDAKISASSTDTLTNKTIDDASNTIQNIAAGAYAAASIDGDDLNSNIAGRSLTLTAASPDTLDADAELYTDTKCIWFEDPTDSDDFQSIWTANGFAATITKIWCESDQTVNADLQVDDGTPADVNGTDLVCDSTPAEDESMGGDATMADGDRLDLAITSVSGTPTWVSICWTYTKDD